MLLLLWFIAPLAILAVTLRATILGFSPWARYLCFLYPAMVLLCALGVEGFTTALSHALQRTWQTIRTRHFHDTPKLTPSPRLTHCALLTCVILITWQILPMLRRSYERPKDDYRAATRYVTATNSPGSVVLLLGNCPDWMVGTGLQYYFEQQDTAITLLAEKQLSSALATIPSQYNSQVWGAISMYPACHGLERIQAIQAVTTALEVKTYPGILLFRLHESPLSTVDQTRILLTGSPIIQP